MLFRFFYALLSSDRFFVSLREIINRKDMNKKDKQDEQLQDSIKETRADLKRTAEKLEKAHPESESIKYGFTVALMA